MTNDRRRRTTRTRRAAVAVAAGTAIALTAAGCSSGPSEGAESESTEITWLVDNGDQTALLSAAYIEAFNAVHPEITVKVQTRPDGSEGDNLVKTKLATGEMEDVFQYNSGSLFQALNPDDNLVNLDDVSWKDDLIADFQTVVSTDNGFYGAPYGSNFAGAVLYNKPLYESLGLSIPTTWDEFLANAEAVKAAGDVAPIVQTYGDPWTSQLFVLADFNNVSAVDPDWADEYTAGNAKFADLPALEGFNNLQEVYEKGLLNDDFASATLDDGIRMVATGEGAHYPALTFTAETLSANNADDVDNVGLFPLPGRSADTNGLTMWLASGLYIPKSTEGAKLEAAKTFLEFFTTTAACDIQSELGSVNGPFPVKACALPDDALDMVKDMQPYVDEGKSSPALEYLSPIKGPALEQIAVEVGSGIRDALDGAKLYDEDVRKQAQQLGLEGW